MFKKIIILICVVFLGINYINAEENNAVDTNSDVDSISLEVTNNSVENTVNESNDSTISNVINSVENKDDTSLYENTTNNDTNIQPENNVVTAVDDTKIKIDEVNFPGETLRGYLLNQDYDEDGYLSNDEINSIEYLQIRYESTGEIDLQGIEKLPKIISIRIDSNNMASIKNIKNIESLSELQILYFSGITLTDDFKSLDLKNLNQINLFRTNINSLNDLKHLTNLKTIGIDYVSDQNLEAINDFAQIQDISIYDSKSIKNISLSKENTTLTKLSLSNTSLNKIDDLKNYTKLESIGIIGGGISDISNVKELVPSSLAYMYISEQNIKSKNTYTVNELYSPNDITILKDDNIIPYLYLKTAGEITGNGIIWKEKSINSYNVNYSSKMIDNLNLTYEAIVSEIYPNDYNETEWIKISDDSEFTEAFTRNNKYIKLIRGFGSSNIGSLFSNKFIIDDKEYTYAYSQGSDNTAKMFLNEADKNEINFSLDSSEINKQIKKENGKYYLKTITNIRFDDKIIQKEELSYVKDESVYHEVKYTNISNESINDISISEMLDTMLNYQDSIPLYSDGKGNAYITADSFTLYLEKIEGVNELIAGIYNRGHNDSESKNIADYPEGKVVLENVDTAIYYTVKNLTLNPNESYTMKYKETVFTKDETPIIKAIDKTINVNDKWDIFDNLIGVYDQLGNELDKTLTKVEHNVNTSEVGVYNIKYTYNKLYSVEVKLYVTNKKQAMETKEVVVKVTCEDEGKVWDESKQGCVIRKYSVPNTSENNIYSIYMLSILSSLFVLLALKYKRNN